MALPRNTLRCMCQSLLTIIFDGKVYIIRRQDIRESKFNLLFSEMAQNSDHSNHSNNWVATHKTMTKRMQMVWRSTATGKWASLLLALALSGGPGYADSLPTVFYSGSSLPDDNRADYYLKLLNLVLNKSGNHYQLRPNPELMTTRRAIQLMGSHGGIDVFWGPTTKDMENEYLPVRVPIDKGILGWRLLLIQSSDRELFAKVRSPEQLQVLDAGLERDWTDTTILRANGYRVVGADAYETMFDMLVNNRFQYFPRGVGEIWGEAQHHPTLEVEKHLALHYPSFTYFFVGKGNTKLAGEIERGLHAAIADGSFEKLFEQYNGEQIRRADLKNRLVFELTNPDLPEHVPAMKPLRDTRRRTD